MKGISVWLYLLAVCNLLKRHLHSLCFTISRFFTKYKITLYEKICHFTLCYVYCYWTTASVEK